MSRLAVGIVAEGPSDIEMIKALIGKLVSKPHDFYELQPDISATPGFGCHGAGWKGIRGWCMEIARDFNGLSQFIRYTGQPLDLLIIHLDADVARESEIDCMQSCPPVEDTLTLLESKLLDWLGETAWPRKNKIVTCFPADNTEAWILSAYNPNTSYHNPPDNPLECVGKAGYDYKRPGL